MWLPWLGAVVVDRGGGGGRRAAVPAARYRREPEPAPRPVLGLGLAAIVAGGGLRRSGPVVGAASVRWRRRGGAPGCRAWASGGSPPGTRVAGARRSRAGRPVRRRGCAGHAGPAWAGPVGAARAPGPGGRLRRSRRWQRWWSTTFRPPLLAARTPPHPFALLIGLNLGPNLCVTGSLAWLLWLRAARGAGARPSLATASASAWSPCRCPWRWRLPRSR